MKANAKRIIAKLKKLQALALLGPGEENDSTRVNEARASALLMVRIAKDNGIEIRFVVPGEEREAARERAEHWQSRPSHHRSDVTVEHEPPTPVPEPQQAPDFWADEDQGYSRYAPPAVPFDPHGRKDGPRGAGQHCVCGKPISTRTWYEPGSGCTHAVSVSHPFK